ncbi:DUF2971 domain-containing protein [Pseudophaeobacter sp. EL27]|uniref:DUF2971 domain-containing protein n=1 Tax=Pseudophaeobacter sp. EL27 TaxID=2107580 RepID=UPI000EFB2673|nr:DUF2971 domain-containing protein [Pseudophaeobacter sp. EL27]
MDETQRKLAKLFMPHAMGKMEAIQANKTRFSHYTSAYAATQIIKHEEVWLRNAQAMNDFSEVRHGEICLAQSWNDPNVGGRLRNLLNSLDDDLSKRFQEVFDSHSNHRKFQSFLLSVSEHDDLSSGENYHGRLSMWRAYGGDTNVALVFNNTPFMSEDGGLQAVSSPVLYTDPNGFKEPFVELIQGLENEMPLLESLGAEEVFKYLYWAFHMASLSVKHPGFSEEKEWRVVYSPSLYGRSPLMKEEVENIAGVPQKIIKLPLKPNVQSGFEGFAISEVLEEIIIGPTETPGLIKEALALLLEERGVPNASDRIRISDIPLRR